MPLIVTLHVYSQRQDPSWILSEAQAREFLQRVRSLGERTPLKAKGIVSRLGYRGFSIAPIPGQFFPQAQLTVNDGIIDPGATGTSFFDRDREIEAWLLETAGGQVRGRTREHVMSALARPAEEAIQARAEHLTFRLPTPECTPKADDAPPFDPVPWNVAGVRLCNNCYNYANDQPLCNYAQPGQAAGVNAGLSCLDLQLAAEVDGLVSKSDFLTKLGPGEGWYVALAFWPGDQDSPPDFHWYRQDKSGCWSHKPGNDEATNLDTSNNVITDPRTCDRSPYTEFCTFMITNNGVVIG